MSRQRQADERRDRKGAERGAVEQKPDAPRPSPPWTTAGDAIRMCKNGTIVAID